MMKSWTPDEDAELLHLIETSGKHWKHIASALKPYDRTPAMVRNRFLRIKRGRWLTEQGRSKNRCGVCGELKRGHVCKSVLIPPPVEASTEVDDEDVLSNSSTSLVETAVSTPNRHGDQVLVDEEGENTAPAHCENAGTATEPSPSVASLVCAEATLAYDPPPAPSPNQRVISVKQLCRLERSDSLEVLAQAASLISQPASSF